MTSDVPRYCKRCRYALHHQPRGTCPECGTFHDRAQPRTWSPHAVSTAHRAQRVLICATAWAAALYLTALLVVTGGNQCDIARQILVTERTDHPLLRWLALNTQHFNPLRQFELCGISALVGAALGLRRGLGRLRSALSIA